MIIPMKHLSVDIESWGKRPGYDIRSVGACLFDPFNPAHAKFDPDATIGGQYLCFYKACYNPLMGIYSKEHHTQIELDCIGGPHRKYNLKRDRDTVEWWHDSRQKEASKDAFDNPVDLKEVLIQFTTFILSISDDVRDGVAHDIVIWCHGAAFDPGLLTEAFYACGLTVPWFYRAPRDTRTIFDDAEVDNHSHFLNKHKFGILHHSLHDSISQARAITSAKQLLIQLKIAVRRLNRENTDLHYRNTMMLQLLGPKALEYMRRQEQAGVVREHVSWGPEAHLLSGEERARTLLDFMDAPREEITDIDGHIDKIRSDAPMSPKPPIDVVDLVKYLDGKE